MSPRRRLNRHLQDLERSREALADAKARRLDPWRVAELQLAHDRCAERALDAEFEPDAELGEPARGPARPWPVRGAR